MIVKPMLAAEYNEKLATFPMYISRKLDGIRFITLLGRAKSRSLKDIPNRHVQDLVRKWPSGLDGELVVGNPRDPNCMQNTTSGVMSYEGTPDISFHMFDIWNKPDLPYGERYKELVSIVEELRKDYTPYVEIHVVEQKVCVNPHDVEYWTAKFLEEGYEGAILRKVSSRYKYGRSTAREGYLLKVKQFSDDEARIIGFEERLHNSNEPTINALGYQERSTHQENMVPTNSLGAFIVQCANFSYPFNIGTGFSESQRVDYWARRAELVGRLVKFKYQPHGVKDVPRIPVFLGFRHEDDT